MKMLRITAKTEKGLRRAGRKFVGITEVAASEFDEAQREALDGEKLLHVEEFDAPDPKPEGGAKKS